ncbi:MAG: pyridoxal-5'-phosphate-dependent protein subunit beta, partial [Erysipelotrichaceae bacterium]|nr:pyridoxal-5'-phosphate-dependent protein subunit beta [Erysipelotrichaceae bacterium]
EKRELETADYVLERWFKDIFLGAEDAYIEDARLPVVKERLFKQKEKDWLKFGYTQEYLDSMRHAEFWENEYHKVNEYDEKIKKMRGKEL